MNKKNPRMEYNLETHFTMKRPMTTQNCFMEYANKKRKFLKHITIEIQSLSNNKNVSTFKQKRYTEKCYKQGYMIRI